VIPQLRSGESDRSIAEGVFLPNHQPVRAGPVEVMLASVARDPDRDLFRWPGGGRMSVGDFADRALRWAGVLLAEGVRPSDRVASFCTNSAEFMALQYGTYAAGAVEVPINSELRGPMLRAVLEDSEPALIVVEAEFRDVVAEQLSGDTRMLVLDDALTARLDATDPAESVINDPADLALILYTSGTTGPSKGVMLPHGYLPFVASNWIAAIGVRPGDVCYFVLPFFHIDAHVHGALSLLSDSVFGFAKRFSVTRFWSEAAEMGATWFGFVGSMGAALVARRSAEPPPHSFRFAAGAPITPEVFAYLENELGIPPYQLYGQTEADHVTFSTPELNNRGSAGWACMGFDVRIVDEFDEPVPVGETGRIVYRPKEPLMMTYGYWRKPEATAAACRNLWWHTGDLGRLDEDRCLWFEGRSSDSLRRRGENISAWELEATVRAAPGVRSAAAVAIRDEIGGEDDVKVFVSLDPEEEWDVLAFFAHCEQNLPRFAVPRFVQVIAEEQIVRGPGTGAIQKHLLPKDNTAETVDRYQILNQTSNR
jgi:crotonobetaine/carnitine-CoA ligase